MKRTRQRIKKGQPQTPVVPDVVSSSAVTSPEPVVSEPRNKRIKLEATARPTPEECLDVTRVLGELHPEIVNRNNSRTREMMRNCGNHNYVLDGIVNTILSQNTRSKNSTRAFTKLKKTFPTWESVMNQIDSYGKPATLAALESAIKCGGLAKTKSERIVQMLATLQEERGNVSFEYLRQQSDNEVKEELGRFPGMGPKTISCVLLFCLGRAEFPVDTHVLRISKLIKWVPSNASREEAYHHLNAVVPNAVKLDLHCLLIAHGKQCHKCAARNKPQFPPKDGTKLKCPLVNVEERAIMHCHQAKTLLQSIKRESISKDVNVKVETK